MLTIGDREIKGKLADEAAFRNLSEAGSRLNIIKILRAFRARIFGQLLFNCNEVSCQLVATNEIGRCTLQGPHTLNHTYTLTKCARIE